MKLLLTTLILSFTAVLPAVAKDTVQIGLGAGIATHKFNLESGRSARFSDGVETGVRLGWVNRNDDYAYYDNPYSIGIMGGLRKVDLENDANDIITQEQLEGYVFALGPRFYALDFFMGMSVTYSSMAIHLRNAGSLSSSEYTGIGYRLEIGADLPLLAKKRSRGLFMSPRVLYGSKQLTKKSNRKSSGVSTLGVSMGLSYNF